MLSIKASKAPHRRQRGGWRRGVLAAAAVIGLTACSGSDTPERGVAGAVTGFAGLVAADEPHAALAARDVLSVGGTAADAAVAAAFTMAVTLPSSAGLGGGGICLVHEPETEDRYTQSKVEVLEFLPGLAPADGTDRAVAVPALPRGMFALHAKYGALRWESLLGPAERMARTGFAASRALAKEFVAGGAVLREDILAVRTFADPRGMSPGSGDTLVQEDLGATIARLRLRGVGDFYQGLMARDVVNAYRNADFALTPEALADLRPRWLEPATAMRGNEIVAGPPQGVPGHETLLAYQAGGNAQQGGRPLPGGSGFVVVDNRGGAVACALTMNGAFGTGRMAPGTGMMIAAAPPQPSFSTLPLGVLMAFNPHVKEFHFAGAAGGAAAGAALGRVAALVLDEDVPVQEAVSGAVSGREDVSGLLAVASCPEGMPPQARLCRVVTDPRGSGYGMVVGKD